MNLEEIQQLFHEKYHFEPATLNELLTFARKCYILNDITIKDYRQLVKEIEAAYPVTESPTVSQ
ncbi:YppF family protein [Bacillus sp. SCS-153A]|uniref:YppF family protein n=1 Tax=Rossellomorea sedimentorum TaxID=3115294 RepID=UPI003906CDC8